MNTRKAFTVAVLALLFLAFFTGLSPLSLTPVANAITPVSLNDLMAEKYMEWDGFVNRYFSTNGTTSEFWSYSLEDPYPIQSGILDYWLALISFYEETGDEYYLRKMQYFLDVFYDGDFFNVETDMGVARHIPTFSSDGIVDSDSTVVITATAAIMALDVYELTGEAKYLVYAQDIVSQSRDWFVVVDNATDLAWSSQYYNTRTEAQAKAGVNRQCSLAWLYARYAPYNATLAADVNRIIHWAARAQLANDGMGYSIGDTGESIPYTCYALFFMLKGYELLPSAYSAASIAFMNATLSRIMEYTGVQHYLVNAVLGATLATAIEGNFVPATGNYSAFAQGAIYNVLTNLQFGERGVSASIYDDPQGFLWSQFFLGALFSVYSLPVALDSFETLAPYWTESGTTGRYYWIGPALEARSAQTIYYAGDAYKQVGQNNFPYTVLFQFGASGSVSSRDLTMNDGVGKIEVAYTSGVTKTTAYVYPDNSMVATVDGTSTAIILGGYPSETLVQCSNGTVFEMTSLSNGTLTLGDKFLLYRNYTASASRQAELIKTNVTTTWTLTRYASSWNIQTASISNYLMAAVYGTDYDNVTSAYSYMDAHMDAIYSETELPYSDISDYWLSELALQNPTPDWFTAYQSAVSTTPKLIAHDHPETTYFTAWSYTGATRTLTFTVHNEVDANTTIALYLGPISPETTYNVTEAEFDNTLGIETLTIAHTSADMVVTLIFQPLATVTFTSSPEVEGYFTVSGSSNYITPETLYLEIDTAYALNCTSAVKAFGDLNYYFQAWHPTGGTYGAVYPTFYSMTLTPQSAVVTVEMVFGLTAPVLPPDEEPVVGEGDVENDYYFHADVQTVNEVSGFAMLTTTPTEAEDVAIDTAGTATISWGWRVYLQYEGSAYEMTGGAPEAVVDQLYGDGDQSAMLSANLTLDQVRLYFGRTALKFDLYSRWNETGDWAVRAVFVTDYLYYPEMEANTVTVNLYGVRSESGGSTYASAYWGTTTYLSGVDGVLFKAATSTDWQGYYLNSGNFLSFLTIPYTVMIGNAFYALALFGVGMSLYIRYRQASILVLFIVLLGGAGGVVQLLIGDLFMGAVWVIAAFGLGLIYWRLFR